MEVGPLSRMVVAYASGQPQVKQLVDGTLAQVKAPPTALFSTLGRIAARTIEAQLMARQLEGWINQLDDNMCKGKLAIHNGEKWDPDSWPKSARGYGFHEAPRGALGHWVEIEDKEDQELPGGGAYDMECWSARGRPARCLRNVADEDADCRSGSAGGSFANHSFV